MEIHRVSGVELVITDSDREAGEAAAGAAVAAGLAALSDGLKPVFWLMAAPSAFSFYQAFIGRAGRVAGNVAGIPVHASAGSGPDTPARVAALVREAEWFQFDDYPIPRGNRRFPVTFRHLLETRFFAPLREAADGLGKVHLLELTGDEAADLQVMNRYTGHLFDVLDSPVHHVIQIKGTGMDGHWGFHGAETPLDAPAGLIRVPMGAANRRQQMIDWPVYFPRDEDVPRYAVTCTVSLFLKAQRIIDITPQPTKEYAVLGCFGDDKIHPELPSSAIKRHPAATSYLTRKSSRALLEYRLGKSGTGLEPSTLKRLENLWTDPENIGDMKRTLARIGIVPHWK